MLVIILEVNKNQTTHGIGICQHLTKFCYCHLVSIM